MNTFYFLITVFVSFSFGYVFGKYVFVKKKESDLIVERYQKARWH